MNKEAEVLIGSFVVPPSQGGSGSVHLQLLMLVEVVGICKRNLFCLGRD